jgi:dsDNA-specific endonuclease/ATPase MutS2
LRRYLYQYQQKSSYELDKRGRKPVVSEKGLEKLQEKVTESALSLNGLTADIGGSFDQTLVEIIKEESTNALAEVKYSSETRRRIIQKNNIRTHISLCSFQNYLQSDVHRSNYHSIDEVSILLNQMGEAPEVGRCNIFADNC